VGLHDTEQWPCAFACDFAFVSADLAPRVAAIEIDAASDASDHQPLLLRLA
jgi:endonuclease/exonuclease/phosphatase family metal-dependent hydrolase